MASTVDSGASKRRVRAGQAEVVLAALAFAASVPASKLLLVGVSPLALSGAVYLSAGVLCGTLFLIAKPQAAADKPAGGVTGPARASVGGAGRRSLSGEWSDASSLPGTGSALVVGACALWGLDNNLTQRVSLRDARLIVAVKGLAGGGGGGPPSPGVGGVARP